MLLKYNTHINAKKHTCRHEAQSTTHVLLTWTTTIALGQFTNKKFTLFYTRKYIQLIIIQQADLPKIKISKVTRTRQDTINYIIIH